MKLVGHFFSYAIAGATDNVSTNRANIILMLQWTAIYLYSFTNTEVAMILVLSRK